MKNYLTISGSLFTVIALMHLLRLVQQSPVSIGAVAVPLWASVLGLVVASSLAAWAFRLSARVPR
jgi:hypothetical protein